MKIIYPKLLRVLIQYKFMEYIRIQQWKLNLNKLYDLFQTLLCKLLEILLLFEDEAEILEFKDLLQPGTQTICCQHQILAQAS